MVENPYQPPTGTQHADAFSYVHPIHARIEVSSDFIRESLQRFRSQRRFRLWWIVFRYFWAACFLLCFVIGIFAREFVCVAMGLASFVFCAFPTQIDDFMADREVYESSDLGRVRWIKFSDKGFSLSGDSSEGRIPWSSCTRFVRFPDGVLIFQSLNEYHWIPESSLANVGDLSRLCDLIDSKLK